jgi:hypothetical protein
MLLDALNPMPFTFSHPALVLPFLLRKRPGLSATGLIMGSVVPDFEYFLRMRKGFSYYSHSWPGLFWFDLPLAVVLALVFHGVVRNPVLDYLPAPLRARFAPYGSLNWLQLFVRTWPRVLLSVLLGALTHLGWDELLHRSADYLYEHQSSILALGEWKRHTSIYLGVLAGHSVVGGGAMLAFIARMPVATDLNRERSLSRPQFWGAIWLLTGLILLLRVKLGSALEAMDMVVSLLAAFLLALVVVSWCVPTPK